MRIIILISLWVLVGLGTTRTAFAVEVPLREDVEAYLDGNEVKGVDIWLADSENASVADWEKFTGHVLEFYRVRASHPGFVSIPLYGQSERAHLLERTYHSKLSAPVKLALSEQVLGTEVARGPRSTSLSYVGRSGDVDVWQAFAHSVVTDRTQPLRRRSAILRGAISLEEISTRGVGARTWIGTDYELASDIEALEGRARREANPIVSTLGHFIDKSFDCSDALQALY